MTNPFKPHALNLFADRDSIDDAMKYANMLLQTLDGPAATAATTALMVVANTAAKLWPEAPAQAEPFDFDKRMAALAIRITGLEDRLSPESLSQDIASQVSSQVCAWFDDNFDERADQWLNDHADLDHEIETWMENNLDVEDAVQDVLRNASLRINF